MGVRETDALLDVAAEQHGAIGVGQLPEGVPRGWVDNLVRNGVLERAAPGVDVVRGSAPTWERSLRVGLLALGAASWVSHEAAAALHRLDRPRQQRVEFTVLRAARGRRMPFCVHTTEALPQIDRVTVDGFRATAATRTLIDLARARVPTPRLEAAIDSAVRRGLTSPLALRDRLAALRGPGRWGARRSWTACSPMRAATRCSSVASWRSFGGPVCLDPARR